MYHMGNIGWEWRSLHFDSGLQFVRCCARDGAVSATGSLWALTAESHRGIKQATAVFLKCHDWPKQWRWTLQGAIHRITASPRRAPF